MCGYNKFVGKKNTQRSKSSIDIISTPKFNFFKNNLSNLSTTTNKPVIVDCGCGGGALIEKLHKVYPQYTFIGCDINVEYLKDKKNTPRLQYQITDLLEISFPKSSINVFICSSILHEIYSYYKKNFSYKALDIFFSNIYSALKPNGLIIIRDPASPDNPQEEVKIIPEKTNSKCNPSNLYDLLNTNLSLLNTRCLLLRFLYEFKPAKSFISKIPASFSDLLNSNSFKLPIWLVSEFIKHRPYIYNEESWKAELKEKYGIFSINKMKTWSKYHNLKLQDIYTDLDPKHQSVQFYHEIIMYNSKGKRINLEDRIHTHIYAMLKK